MVFTSLTDSEPFISFFCNVSRWRGNRLLSQEINDTCSEELGNPWVRLWHLLSILRLMLSFSSRSLCDSFLVFVLIDTWHHYDRGLPSDHCWWLLPDSRGRVNKQNNAAGPRHVSCVNYLVTIQSDDKSSSCTHSIDLAVKVVCHVLYPLSSDNLVTAPSRQGDVFVVLPAWVTPGHPGIRWELRTPSTGAGVRGEGRGQEPERGEEGRDWVRGSPQHCVSKPNPSKMYLASDAY